MDDSGGVRVSEAVRDGEEDFDLAPDRERLGALDLLVEVLAAQELLHDVGDPVLDAEVVDRRDVPVVEVPGELRLAEEPALDLLVVQLAGFDGDRPLDVRVAPAVDRAEATGTDLPGDLVFADLFRQLGFLRHCLGGGASLVETGRKRNADDGALRICGWNAPGSLERRSARPDSVDCPREPLPRPGPVGP